MKEVEEGFASLSLSSHLFSYAHFLFIFAGHFVNVLNNRGRTFTAQI